MIPKPKTNLLKGLLFISPWIIGLAVFILYPFFASLYYSLCYYNIFDKPQFIGLTNYINLFKDRVFWISLWNTFYFSFFSIPLGLFVSIILALLLNTQVKGKVFFRLIFHIPSLVPIVACSILWLWIFNGEYGILNYVLNKILGIPRPPNWLADAKFAKPAIILMSLWGVGNAVVIYLAALQDVPVSLLEAAEIDGANWFKKIIHVTLPSISPAIFFNVIMGIIGSFQVFVAPFIMTGGGPGRATTFYTLYLYQKAFEDFSMGYASAMAWILFLIILGLTGVGFKISKQKVFYIGA